MLAFFDLGNEINVIHLAFAETLVFVVQSTNFGTQKINNTILKTYEIIIAVFLVID